MIKRVLLFLLLLPLLSLTAFADNPCVDGWINLHSEYHETVSILQSEKNESNNNVRYAMLCWTSSPKDYSVFLALSYSLSDYVKGGGQSGVEITVNNDLCAVVHADGTITDLNDDLFDVDFCFGEFDENVESELQCEARVGIKYGLDRLIEVGIRILDCGGVPSNYYRRVVYTPPRADAWTETTTTQTKTTTRPTGPESAAVRPAETSTTAPRITRPVITAAQGTRPLTSNAETSESSSRSVSTETVRASAKPAQRSAGARAQTTKKHSTVPAGTTAAMLSASATAAQAETTADTGTNVDTSSVSETAVQSVVRYRETSKLRLVGSVLGAVLLTSALFVGIFAGINAKRRKNDPPVTPQEQHEDLG